MTREFIEQLDVVEPNCYETDREEIWYKVGLVDGLKIADEHPNLESLWHYARVRPKENSEILIKWNIKGNSGYESYHTSTIENWERFLEKYGVSIWAYIDDLLPKQFGNPEQLKGGEK